MLKLKASKDRKVANAVSPNGKTALIANSFGLPAGAVYSCPGMTEVCNGVCYAGKLEKLFKGVMGVMLHNWNLVKDADEATTTSLIDDMIIEFERQCDKRGADKIFRISWDGDLFSATYTAAWIEVIRRHASVQFWVYTRVATHAVMIHKAGLPNVSLYFSADKQNLPVAAMLNKVYGIRLAYLADNFQQGQKAMREITGKPGARCPEQTSQLDMISTAGSACARCGLCVRGRSNIVFSASKR
jgi:hypothetical protein